MIDKETDWTLSGSGMQEFEIVSWKIYCFSRFISMTIIGTFRL